MLDLLYCGGTLITLAIFGGDTNSGILVREQHYIRIYMYRYVYICIHTHPLLLPR